MPNAFALQESAFIFAVVALITSSRLQNVLPLPWLIVEEVQKWLLILFWPAFFSVSSKSAA